MEAASVAATGVAEPQQQISDMGRVVGVLTSPSATFADIVSKPKWVTPIVLCILMSLAFSFVLNQRMNWRAYVAKQIETGPFSDRIPADRKPQIIAEGAQKAPGRAYVFGSIAHVVLPLWLALVYWGSFNILAGAQAKFKTAFSIAAHSMLPLLIASPVSMLVMYLKPYGEIAEPEHILATSVGSFLPESVPRWAQSFAGSFELFWIWILILIAIGFRAVNPKKISFSGALSIVIGVWLVGVLVKVGAVAAFFG